MSWFLAVPLFVAWTAVLLGVGYYAIRGLWVIWFFWWSLCGKWRNL